MHTARFSDSGGGGVSLQRTPGQRPSLDRDPPGRNMGPGTETSLEGAMDQAARQEVTSYRDPIPLWTE